jgi:hypothetical protein
VFNTHTSTLKTRRNRWNVYLHIIKFTLKPVKIWNIKTHCAFTPLLYVLLYVTWSWVCLKTSKYVVYFCVFVTHQQMFCQMIFVFLTKLIRTENIAWAFLGLDRKTGKVKLIAGFLNFLRKCSNLSSVHTTNCTIQSKLIRLHIFIYRKPKLKITAYVIWERIHSKQPAP